MASFDHVVSEMRMIRVMRGHMPESEPHDRAAPVSNVSL